MLLTSSALWIWVNLDCYSKRILRIISHNLTLWTYFSILFFLYCLGNHLRGAICKYQKYAYIYPPKNQNYLLEGKPLVVQASPAKYSRNPSASVYQLALVWEAVFDFSGFFWRLFHCICPFHDGWFMSSSAHTTLSVQQFLTKNGWPHVPPSLFTHLVPTNFFHFPGWKKSSKGNILPMWKRWNKTWQKH